MEPDPSQPVDPRGSLKPLSESHALPLVSVLIRSMDRAFLTQALESVAMQTYSNIEVVVIAVRPGHRSLGSHCGSFPLRLVTTDAPVPRSAAANRAIAAARGESLIFLDDDDWMMPGHIARLAEVLAKLPQAQATYTGISLVDANGKPVGQAFDLPFDPVRQLAGNLMPIHAVLFRASVTAQGCRFDETLDRLEDWDFWLQVSKLAPMVHLPGVSAVYRIHDSSGVHSDAGPEGAASRRIYQKWESDWTAQQIGQIMQRVWTYPELESRLIDTSKQLMLAEQRAANDQTVLAQQMVSIAQQATTIAHQAVSAAQQQQQHEHQRHEFQQRVNELTQDLHGMTASLAHSERERLAIVHSRLWRLTQPLRKTGTRLKSTSVGPYIARAWRVPRVLITEGPLGLFQRIKTHFAVKPLPPMDYRQWARTLGTLTEKQLGQLGKSISAWQHKPLISIIMPVYNPPLDLLRAAINSIQAQVYPHWELCIADDASPDTSVWQLLQDLANSDHRIKAMRRPINGHISLASNSALELASGEFIALMDNDDLLPADALYWVAEAVNRHPTAKVIYSDEDKLDAQGERFGEYFKPDWNYTLFLGHNMISHLGVYQTQLVRDVGCFRQELEGSQDYDLALRCIEKIDPSQIVHIPKVLYHWRAIEGSTALSIESKPYALYAAQRALQEHLLRTGSTARAERLPSLNYKCARSVEGIEAGLTVILVCPQGDKDCDGTSAWTTDPAYKVGEVLTCTAQGSAINAAVASARGALVALVRVDLRPSGPSALLELVGHALEKPTGAVAGTVRDTSDRLLSGGFILNPVSIASVMHHYLPSGNHGYAGRGFLSQELSAVSMDCVVFRKEVFDAYGGFDADLGIGPLGAVAWCLRLREHGYRMIWCPDAQWSAVDDAPRQSSAQTNSQRKIFMSRYTELSANWLQRDPAYHPLLNAVTADFSLLP